MKALFRKPTLWCLAAVLVIGVGILYAQIADVDNPTKFSFTASSDHGTIDAYEADIVDSTGVIVQTLALGKPTPDASNTITINLNVQPIKFANGYSIRVRAKAGTTVSTDAVSQNKFNRRPGAPGGVKIG